MIVAMIKSAIVLAVAACVASLMKRQSAAVRHAVWTAGLAGAMAIPLCTLTLPSWEISLVEPATAFLQRSLAFPGNTRQAAITIWIAGAAAGMLLLLYSAGRLAWVAIGAHPVEDARWAAIAEEVRNRLGIRRPVRLVQNRSVPFLGTWGILVPRVLLPRDAEAWPDHRVRMVLAHELAHIQRHDWVVQVLADAARAIYWFNPIFWLASSRLRRESEYACDDAVLRLGSTGTRYAEELLAMTRALRTEQRLRSPILAMAQPSHLEQRLVALLNPSLNRLAATPWAVVVVAAFAIALTLPLAAVRPEEVRGTLTPAQPPAPLPTPTPTPAAAIEPPVAPPKVAKKSVPKPTPEPPAPTPVTTVAPVNETPLPPFVCSVTPSTRQMKVSSLEKMALGDGPWIINDDRTIWAADQPYVANKTVTTVWMRPANTELTITARRLDGNTADLTVGPAAPYRTAYIAIGVTFPSAGCWEVTAKAGDSTLKFVTKVQD
jgi:beta-lactamase regulating signal transducer with metallopeptidase domain